MEPLFGVNLRLRSMLSKGSTRRSGTDPFTLSCSMRPAICILNAVGEFELVEDKARDQRRSVRIVQAAFDARGGEPHVAGLHAERGGERGEAQIERCQLDLDPTLLRSCW